jgi:hypothetical protein
MTGQALGRWDAALTELGVLHSPILDAVSGWLIASQDPDGNRIRLYTLESHGPEVRPATNSHGWQAVHHSLSSIIMWPMSRRNTRTTTERRTANAVAEDIATTAQVPKHSTPPK